MQKVMALWPGLAHILLYADTPMEDLRTELAACCLLAIRTHSDSFAPLLAPFCQLAAASFQSAPRAKFAQALSQAIAAYPGQDPAAQQPLRQALDLVSCSPAVRALQAFGQADACPDFAMVRAMPARLLLAVLLLSIPVQPVDRECCGSHLVDCPSRKAQPS